MCQQGGKPRKDGEKDRNGDRRQDFSPVRRAAGPSLFFELDLRWLKFGHSRQDPATVSRAISIIPLKVVCRSSAVVDVPFAMWSDTVKRARASRPNLAARV